MKRKFQLKKYTAVFIAVLMMISSIGTVGVSADAITASFDADQNLIIENTTDGVISSNTTANVTGTDVVFSVGGSVTYEISNVPETGWYMISTVGMTSKGSSSKYYTMTVSQNGNTWSGAATCQNYEHTATTIKVGSVYLEAGKTNTFDVGCKAIQIDATTTVKLLRLKIQRKRDIELSSLDETKIAALDFTNRVFRIANGDADEPNYNPAAGSAETVWRPGKVTAEANHYGIYNVSVDKKTTFEVYSLAGTPNDVSATFYVDGVLKLTKKLTRGSYPRNVYDKLGTIELEPGSYALKYQVSTTVYFFGLKLVPVGGDMLIKNVMSNDTAVTTDTPVAKSTDTLDVTFNYAPKASDINEANISVVYDTDKKVSAELVIDGKKVSINFKEALLPDTTYTLNLKNIKAAQGDAQAIPDSTYSFITSEAGEISGRVVCDEKSSEYETVTLKLTAFSGKDVKIKGRNIEVYRKAPATAAVPAPEDELVATTVSGDDGAITVVDNIPLSSELYPAGFPYGAYIYTVKCDYCEALPIEIIYISKAREAELLGKLALTTSVNDGSDDGTDDDVEPFFETYQTELGVNLDTDLVNITDRAKVYRHFVGAEISDVEEFKSIWNKVIYAETINCAEEATKSNITDILENEDAQTAFNLPKDKLAIVLERDSAGLTDAVLAFDEIASPDDVCELISAEIEKLFMTICGKSNVTFDSSILNISVIGNQAIELPLTLSAEATDIRKITLKIKSDDTTFTENVTILEFPEDVEVASSWNAGVLTVELAYPYKTAVTEIGTLTLTPATTSSTHTIKVSGSAVYDVNLDTNAAFDVEEDIPVVGGINEVTYTVTVTQSSSGVTQGPQTTRPSTPAAPSRPSAPAPSKPGKTEDIMPTVKPVTPVEPDEPDVPDVPDVPKGFTDIADVSWAEESINKLLELGVVSQSEDGKFNPNNNIKRSEFIKLIVEALDLNDENATSSFDDVAEDAWYYTYAAAAQKAGIVLGGDDGKFNPESYITRQDMSVIIARALTLKGIDSDNSEVEVFNDDAEMASYAKDAIYLLKTLGIINGTGENNFSPLGNATRAQTAKMVCGILEVVSK